MRRVLLVFLGLTISLLAAEGLLRFFSPEWSDQWRMWRLHPVYTRGLRVNVNDEVVHGHSGEFAFRFSTNKQGLRMDREFSPVPDAGTRRILLVGDSFTFGYGVDQGETFANHLERMTNSNGSRAEVLNAGFASGYTLDTEYLFTREVGSGWHPADVVVGVCLSNDLRDMGQNTWNVKEGRLISISKDNDWVPVWAKKSGLVNLAAKGAWPGVKSFLKSGSRAAAQERKISPCDTQPPRDANLTAGTPPDQPPVFPDEFAGSGKVRQRVDLIMQAWSGHAAHSGYRLTLMLIPDAREVQRATAQGGYPYAGDVRQTFSDAARRAGIRVIDPVRAMYDHVCGGGEPLYFDSDGHWNAAGHQFIGEWLMTELFDGE